MPRARFLRLWTLWSAFYLVLAVVGPNGLVPVPVWPVVSQHVLQTRAWLGDDILAPRPDTTEDLVIPVAPSLEVTPYFRHRVVRDPREDALIANLAVALRAPGGLLTPIQAVWSGSDELLESASLVCHVGFPLGPSLLLLPFYWILGGLLATQWLGALLGGLAVAVMDRLMTDWSAAMGMGNGIPGANAMVWLAGAGTLWLWIAPDGGTFLFAQVVGTTALSIAMLAAWRGHRWVAGVALGLAITSRPSMLGALPILLAFCLLRGEASPEKLEGIKGRSLITNFLGHCGPLLAGPAVFGTITLLLNKIRFGSLGEFGYSFMIVPPFLRERLAEHGQLSWAYLARNLQYVGLQAPMVIRDHSGDLVFPYLASNPHGMGLVFVAPAFLALAAAVWVTGRSQNRVLATAWLSLALVCLPGLLYYNTGWVQWGGRFLIDAWPLWLLLAAIGLRRLPPRLSIVLIVMSVVSNGWGALLVALRVWPGCCM